jgi:hypothetical protein
MNPGYIAEWSKSYLYGFHIMGYLSCKKEEEIAYSYKMKQI